MAGQTAGVTSAAVATKPAAVAATVAATPVTAPAPVAAKPAAVTATPTPTTVITKPATVTAPAPVAAKPAAPVPEKTYYYRGSRGAGRYITAAEYHRITGVYPPGVTPPPGVVIKPIVQTSLNYSGSTARR
jgi:hypothetical protein